MTRRKWMAAAAASVVGANPQPAQLGAELYTVRDLLKKDPDGALRAVAAIGYREVEGARAELVEWAARLKADKLAPVACHIETPLVTGNWALWKMKPVGWSEALDSAKSAGVEYMVLPYLQPPERKDFDQLAEKMNAAGEQCRRAGLEFCYHNHAFEFQGRAGERPIDRMLAKLDPKLVGLEVDVFWVSTAGNDPVEFLNRNAGRVPLLHLKDKRPGTPVQYSEQAVSRQAFMEVGSGTLDFPAILKAAAAAGTRHCFVEQDQTPGDPLASLRKSYQYLKGLHSPDLQV